MSPTRRHYNNFINIVVALMVFGGLMGIFLFFETGNILHVAFGGLYVFICIMAMTDKRLEKKILGG